MSKKHIRKPIKVTFRVDEKKRRIYAFAKYHGETIRGVAKCGPRDEFKIPVGKELAKARLMVKLLKKKFDQAIEYYQLCVEEEQAAKRRTESMKELAAERAMELKSAEVFLEKFEAAVNEPATAEELTK